MSQHSFEKSFLESNTMQRNEIKCKWNHEDQIIGRWISDKGTCGAY